MKLSSLSSMSVALALFVYSCDSTKDSSPTGPDFETLPEAREPDRAAAGEKAAAAKEELGRVLSDIYDADEIDLDQIDFTQAERLYREAIAADPRNTEAQFGAALTHLLALATNEDVRALQDSLNAYTGGDEGSGKLALGALNLAAAAETASKSPLLVAKMTQDAIDDPLKVSDIQKTIEEEILPAIDYSLERLRIVEGDPDFTFELTPELQGDEDEEPREIDLGEAYLIDAGLRLTKAVFLVAIAYDFDFDDNGSYEFLEDGSNENVLRHMERLDKTGTFMTLRSADAMPGAKASILTAMDKIEQGLEAIRAETDDQEDDIILADDLDDLDEEIDLSDQEDLPVFFRDISTIGDALNKVREILEGTVEIEADFDGDSDTPEQTVVFDVGRFFDNPVRDLRTLLPYHTWHLDRLQNRNFADELVLTDASGATLEKSPPLIFPDPSFGGVFKSIGTNEELFDLFGFEDENHNKKDLLYEIGLVSARDGGIFVTNEDTPSIEVIYSGYTGGEWIENSVTVPAGTRELDVVRSEVGRPLAGDSDYDLRIVRDGVVLFDNSSDYAWVFGNIYCTVSADMLTIEEADNDRRIETPWNVYESRTYRTPDAEYVGSGKLYWAEQNRSGTGRIRRANLDGSDAELLLTGLDVPRGLSLDVVGGKLYWTEWESDSRTSKIQRANLDGSDVEPLLTDLDFNVWELELDAAAASCTGPNGTGTRTRRRNEQDPAGKPRRLGCGTLGRRIGFLRLGTGTGCSRKQAVLGGI